MQNAPFPWDSVFAIVSFLIGLAIGFIQLWQAQKYFLADQQTKFDKIGQDITQIAQRLAVIEDVTDRLVDIDRAVRVLGVVSDSFQSRLFGIVERQFATKEQAGQATIKTSDRIKELVAHEFESSGTVTGERLTRLDEKLDNVLSSFTQQILSLAQPATTQLETKIESSSNTPTVIELDEQKKQIWISNQSVRLTQLEYSLLKRLYGDAGRLVTLDQLVEAAGAQTPGAISEEAIFSIMYRLRQKIEPNVSNPRYILTVPGKGFILVNASLRVDE